MELKTIIRLKAQLEKLESMQKFEEHFGYQELELEFHKTYLEGQFSGIFEFTWKDWLKEQPKEGFELLAYSEHWIDLDFNPLGIRVGFLNGDGLFYAARWCNYHDAYETGTDVIPRYWIEYPFLQKPIKCRHGVWVSVNNEEMKCVKCGDIQPINSTL